MNASTYQAEPVAGGAPERLAQLAYLGSHHAPRSTAAHEVDDLAFHFIGDVGSGRLRDLWESLREDCTSLWHLQSGSWSEDDLDDLSEADEQILFPHAQAELTYRMQITRDRLTDDIESAIRAARVVAAEARRAEAAVA